MDLGTFSVSLTVKDLPTSREFYANLGFTVFPADPSWAPEQAESYNKNWVILENAGAKIGLFQGMFDKNTLTFNPPDVRAVQAKLEEAGVELLMKAEDGTGPAHCMCLDPDGNPVLLDQH